MIGAAMTIDRVMAGSATSLMLSTGSLVNET